MIKPGPTWKVSQTSDSPLDEPPAPLPAGCARVPSRGSPDLNPLLANRTNSSGEEILRVTIFYLFMGGYPKFWVKMASGELSIFDAFQLTK